MLPKPAQIRRGGSIGTGGVARAAPDGYTLVIGIWTTHVVNGAIYALQYDVLNDFEPVTLLANNPQVIVANKSMPAGSISRQRFCSLKITAPTPRPSCGHWLCRRARQLWLYRWSQNESDSGAKQARSCANRHAAAHARDRSRA